MSEEEKEITRLKRELRDANDAIYILKKLWAFLRTDKIIKYSKGLGKLKRTVSKYMKQLGIRACWIKKYRLAKAAALNDKSHNVLEQQFNPERPDAVWCTDITFIWTGNGFVYLSSIMIFFFQERLLHGNWQIRWKKNL